MSLASTYSLRRARDLESMHDRFLTSEVTWQKCCLDLHARARWHYYSLIAMEPDEVLRQLCELAYTLSCEIERLEVQAVLGRREDFSVEWLHAKSEVMDRLLECNEKIAHHFRALKAEKE